MILATVKIKTDWEATYNGQHFKNLVFTESKLYHSENDFIKETFSPETEIVTVIRFQLHGKTYSERKKALKQLAIELLNSEIADLSYSEECDIFDYLFENAKRYGLIKEFEAKGIF